ncbi:hypothetical protein ACHAXR_009931 [Thalassiosira sp. AJA248-18]
MMKSEHLNESDSHENRLHHRETASHHVHNDAVDQQYPPSNGHGSSNGPTTVPPPSPKTRKRRSMNFWEKTSGHLRIDVNDNYAKYGKKRVKKNMRLQSYIFLGTICIVSFVLGFIWRKYFAGEDLRSTPHLRHHVSDTTPQWKPHTHKTPPNPYSKLESKQQQLNDNKNKLLIPRFDTRRYIASWEKNERNAALGQIGIKHPKSISLEGWNFPIAFRSFPYARQIHGPIKNLDSDYGGLTYHSVKNEEIFGRVIPKDEEDYIVPGGFDPDSIEPEQSLKKRNAKRKETSGAYPNFDSNGKETLHEDATFEELRKYYDDDNVNVVRKANDGVTKEPRACQNAEFSHFYFPTCNNFHERDVGRAYDDPEKLVNQRPENELYVKYLAHGYYRDVWVMEDSPWIWPSRYPKEKHQKSSKKYGVENEERTSELVTKAYRSTAMKTLQMRHPFNDEQFEEVQLEAVIMERMTKSPRIMDIYGHCSYSTMVEVVPIEFEEVAVPGEGYEAPEDVKKRNKNGLRPYNDFTATEKLGFALEMAESLADLHGFEDGVIVHDDVQLCQWLHTPDRQRLKLGDFNRATIMQWDSRKGEYCRFNNGEAFANYRAPEEYAIKNLNEQIDTFSFGNNIYAMLTGLWNFYDTDDDEVVQTKLIDGKLPFVDSRYRDRSFAEKKLIELMEKCWIYDPDERISMFDAVTFLRKAIKENEAHTSSHEYGI